MVEIVNLRLHRKRKARAQKEQQVGENRALHGRSKPQRARETADASRFRTHMDGHRLDEDGGRKDR